MEGLTANRPAKGRFADVTLVTNADYAMGAKALLHSIAQTGTEADLVVLHTGGASEADLAPLAALNARLIRTDLLPTSNAFNDAHARAKLHGAAPFTKGEKPPFHTPLDNFAKLRLWQLTDYDRVVFLDADTLMLRNCNKLFGYPEFSAAPNVYESLADFHRLNSGVFVAQPNAETFANMLETLDQPGAFWRRTDQTLLQACFPDWHGLPVTYNMLQYVWFNMPGLWDWSQIRILHYQYEKPWDAQNPRAAQLKPLIDLWHTYANGDTPDLSDLKNP